MRASVLEKPATDEDVSRLFDRITSKVSDAVEDRARSANEAIKHARYAAEDAIDETRHTIKHRPFQAIAIAFAAGVLAGTFLTWIGLRRR
jgi:ElaB/YqjD/DUF883 family membrane-anchored ribosome-binding protein